MKSTITLRRLGLSIVMIGALAACSSPSTSPSVEPSAPVASASAEPTPEQTEGQVITPSVDEEPSTEPSASEEPETGDLSGNHPFNDAPALVESLSAGFEMFGLGPIAEEEAEGHTVFISESADGDALVIVPSEDGQQVETLRLVDVDALTEVQGSPMLMWSTMLTAILPDDSELSNFVAKQVFEAEPGTAIDASETFGGLEVTVTSEDQDVTVTVERAG